MSHVPEVRPEGLTALESALRRDRAIVLAGLVALVALAWLYLIHLARGMAEMELHAAMGMAMPQLQAWTVTELALTFLMWTVMMVAMMVPSAAPMILLFATIHRRRRAQQQPTVPAAGAGAGLPVTTLGIVF